MKGSTLSVSCINSRISLSIGSQHDDAFIWRHFSSLLERKPVVSVHHYLFAETPTFLPLSLFDISFEFFKKIPVLETKQFFQFFNVQINNVHKNCWMGMQPLSNPCDVMCQMHVYYLFLYPFVLFHHCTH